MKFKKEKLLPICVAKANGVKMKPVNKRINKKKASKVTLKNHRKHNRTGDLHEQMKKAAEGLSSVRPEDIKLHQHY
ncbi:MAG: hypothetical protein JSR39_08875 [Verrucomicrobia bacterium]|nr:hypothetical protein [Verrucomicrobiota bacterium]